MTNLVETNNVLPGRQINFGKDRYVEVSAIGDGNCAFNAFALGLIDLIQRDQLNSDNDKKNLNDLMAAIRSELAILIERQKLYANQPSNIHGNAYADLAEGLNQFINFVRDASNTTDDFINYVKAQTARFSIAALHVGLAPALRKIGVDLYVGALKNTNADADMLADAENLKQDGEFAGQDALPQLAKKFDLNLQTAIDKKSNPAIYAEKAESSSRPSISLVHVPGHYNYAYPEAQGDGLAQHLSENGRDYQSTRLADELILLSQEHQKQIKAKSGSKKLINKSQMTEVSNLVKLEAETLLAGELAQQDMAKVNAAIASIADAVKTNISQHSSGGAEAYQASVEKVLQRQTGASKSSATKDSAYITEVKGLLFNGVPAASKTLVSDDEALARALQNAEILDFLNENYDALTAPSKDTQPPSLRRR